MRVIGYIYPLFFPVLLILIWQYLVYSEVLSSSLLASPGNTLISFWGMLLNGKIFLHSWVSLQRLFWGYFWGAVFGVMIGIALGTNQFFRKIFHPTISFISPIPIVAFIPLIITFMGIGELSKIFLIFLATFFVVYSHAFSGVLSVDEKYIELAKVYKKNIWELIQQVIFPSTLGHIFLGLKISLGLSWVILLVAEMIASDNGLGWLITDSRNFSRTDDLFVAIITIAILSKVLNTLIIFIEKKVLFWQQNFLGNYTSHAKN